MVTKIIWMYWQQGWEQAPELVQRCKASWIRWNPDFEVRALTERTFFEYVTFPKAISPGRRDLPVQKTSALLRLDLLLRYGGIWADATVMCTRPLREWLEPYYTRQFFAFRNPGPDRLMSNWFIAAEPGSILLQRLHKDFFNLFINNHFSNQETALGKKLVDYFNRRWTIDVPSTLKWHSWFARKILRVYPYFIFHYTFNKLILSDPVCAAEWDQVRSFPADGPHRLQNLSPNSEIEQARKEIDAGYSPMHKLNWRVNLASDYWTAVLDHLEAKA